MGRLSVEHAVAVDLKLPDEGAGVLAEVVEYLDNASIFEDGLETQGKRVDLRCVKDVAHTSEAHLAIKIGMIYLD